MGCSSEERAKSQPIDVHIKISFFNEPPGCQSDLLTHVICYKSIVKSVTNAVSGHSFNLIEFVAAYIYNTIASQPMPNGVLEVSIAKPHHPLADVHDPIVFKYARRLPQKSS